VENLITWLLHVPIFKNRNIQESIKSSAMILLVEKEAMALEEGMVVEDGLNEYIVK